MDAATTREKLVSLLHRSKDGVGVEALARSLGVTITAVRQHLVALERDGVVGRGDTVPSGGRPQQLYVLTAEGRETFPRQYSWFSDVLIARMKDDLGPEKLKKTLRILGQDAAAPGTGTLKERAAQLVSTMQTLGYDATLDELEVSAHNCVFHKLAEKHPEVCSFDLGLIETVADADVDQRECIVKGGSVCRFRLKKRS